MDIYYDHDNVEMNAGASDGNDDFGRAWESFGMFWGRLQFVLDMFLGPGAA